MKMRITFCYLQLTLTKKSHIKNLFASVEDCNLFDDDSTISDQCEKLPYKYFFSHKKINRKKMLFELREINFIFMKKIDVNNSQ